MNYRLVRNDELYHHGVKGMKWGVRKEPQNSAYSEKQRKRDLEVYGRGGVKRINRSMNEGSSISGARSKEAARINDARRKATVAGQVGATVGQMGGAAAGVILSKYAKTKISDEAIQAAATPAISFGASTVGKQLGRYGAQSLTMVLHGYSPSKYRSASSSKAKGAFEGTDTFYVKDGKRIKAAEAIPNAYEQRLNAEAAARTAAKKASDYHFAQVSANAKQTRELFDKMDAARSSGNKELQKKYEEMLRESLRRGANL